MGVGISPQALPQGMGAHPDSTTYPTETEGLGTGKGLTREVGVGTRQEARRRATT